MSTRIVYVTRLGPRHKSREVYRGSSLDKALAAMPSDKRERLGAEVVLVGTLAALRAEGAFTTQSGMTMIDTGFPGYVRCEVATRPRAKEAA
ncbi:MAG: hypothetical protein ACHREM_00965 [Polyangiales bacterium]